MYSLSQKSNIYIFYSKTNQFKEEQTKTPKINIINEKKNIEEIHCMAEETLLGAMHTVHNMEIKRILCVFDVSEDYFSKFTN